MREQTITFFTKAHFWFFFFSKSCLKVGGAAYTRVFTVYTNQTTNNTNKVTCLLNCNIYYLVSE